MERSVDLNGLFIGFNDFEIRSVKFDQTINIARFPSRNMRIDIKSFGL